MKKQFDLNFLISKIEELCTQKQMSVKATLEDCGLKRVVVDNMKKGSVPSVDKVFILANYFGVSVDYLLGRTDEPYITGGHSIQTGSIGDNSSYSDTSVKISDNTPQKQFDETSQQLIQAFQTLDLIGKSKVMGLVGELNSK